MDCHVRASTTRSTRCYRRGFEPAASSRATSGPEYTAFLDKDVDAALLGGMHRRWPVRPTRPSHTCRARLADPVPARSPARPAATRRSAATWAAASFSSRVDRAVCPWGRESSWARG